MPCTQVYKALLDGVQPLAVKQVPLGDDPAVQAAFLRVSQQLAGRRCFVLSGPSLASYVCCKLRDVYGQLLALK